MTTEYILLSFNLLIKIQTKRKTLTSAIASVLVSVLCCPHF